MIFYKPITDTDKLKELFPDEKLTDAFVYGGYIGYDEENKEVGKCFVKIDGYSCYVSSVSCDRSDKLLTEGFLRSALNFSANRNAYTAFCSDESISDTLSLLGFKKENNIYSGDIPTLLKGSCCK